MKHLMKFRNEKRDLDFIVEMSERKWVKNETAIWSWAIGLPESLPYGNLLMVDMDWDRVILIYSHHEIRFDGVDLENVL